MTAVMQATMKEIAVDMPCPAPHLPEASAWLAGASIPGQVAVAWSGGADSTALLLALLSRGHRVEAWHVDHGWRRQSADEAKRLGQLAASWGVPFVSVRCPQAAVANREAAARDFRYRQFALWAETRRIHALCLGHHREDQAETVCLRMLQGAGPHGIRGMASVREQDGLRLLRPLLHVPRRTLRDALSRIGVAWLEDASNRDASLWRNRIRHRLFPAMQAAGTDPFRLYLRWGTQAARLAAVVDAEIAGVALTHAAGGVSLPWPDWADLSPPLRARMLQRMMQALFGQGVVPGRRHIRMVEAWTCHGGAGGLDLSRSRLSRHRGRLHLTPAGAKLAGYGHD